MNGRTVVFKKELVMKGLFLYSCGYRSEGERFGSPSRGFHSERDLAPEEVERLPQFLTFLPRNI